MLAASMVAFPALLLPGQGFVLRAQSAPDEIGKALDDSAFDLASDGFDFLTREARDHDFFLFGELHGDNEVPNLLKRIWPVLWASGYRHVAAEMSPWAAEQYLRDQDGPQITTLWTRAQAAVIRSPPGARGTGVIWGCDMEEVQPQFLIREMARLNPKDAKLQRMEALTANGYQRSLAPELLELLEAAQVHHDRAPNGISLRANLLATLEIEKGRAVPAALFSAQNQRELLMKQQFVAHYRANGHRDKVLARFGQSHLFRGYDNERGRSTLGNFIAEFAVAEYRSTFHVAAFGAGGQMNLNGRLIDADQRKDDPGLSVLESHARFDATVFDMRPLRPLLHRIDPAKRTATQRNLTEWVDGYDALICYRNVTPLTVGVNFNGSNQPPASKLPIYGLVRR
jgi:hypothetical protein